MRGGLNTFIYVGGSPLNYGDSLGLFIPKELGEDCWLHILDRDKSTTTSTNKGKWTLFWRTTYGFQSIFYKNRGFYLIKDRYYRELTKTKSTKIKIDYEVICKIKDACGNEKLKTIPAPGPHIEKDTDTSTSFQFKTDWWFSTRPQRPKPGNPPDPNFPPPPPS